MSNPATVYDCWVVLRLSWGCDKKKPILLKNSLIFPGKVRLEPQSTKGWHPMHLQFPLFKPNICKGKAVKNASNIVPPGSTTNTPIKCGITLCHREQVTHPFIAQNCASWRVLMHLIAT